jgi:hypothetical protein
MLSSSPPKIHNHSSPACPRDPRTGDSARNCETRGVRRAATVARYGRGWTCRPIEVVWVCGQKAVRARSRTRWSSG